METELKMPISRSRTMYERPAPHNDQNQAKIKPRKPLTVIQDQSPALDMSITDCTCPICLEILVEPVVLPCKHELCLPCFSGMTDKTNFLCPMCRMRISTWSRTATNTNTLVNVKRWNEIQKAFPNEVRDRIEGKTAQKLEDSMKRQKTAVVSSNAQNISKPGELRQEYEMILKREQERLRIERQNEENMSLNYIEQVIAQEEHLTVNDYVQRIQSITPRTPNNQSNNDSIEPKNKSVNPPTTSSTQYLTVPSNDTPEPRIRTRGSLKRNIDDVKSIRTRLLTSIAESKSITDSDAPKRKLKSRLGVNVSLLDDESADTRTDDDSLNVPNTPKSGSGLQRRQSARLRRPVNL